MGTHCSKHGQKSLKKDQSAEAGIIKEQLMSRGAPSRQNMADSGVDPQWSISTVFGRDSVHTKDTARDKVTRELASSMRAQLAALQSQRHANRMEISIKTEQLQLLISEGLSQNVDPAIVKVQSESFVEDIVYLQSIDETIRQNSSELKTMLLSVEKRHFRRSHDLDKRYLKWAGDTESVHKLDIGLQERCVEAEDSLQELNAEMLSLQQTSLNGGAARTELMDTLFEQQLRIANARTVLSPNNTKIPRIVDEIKDAFPLHAVHADEWSVGGVANASIGRNHPPAAGFHLHTVGMVGPSDQNPYIPNPCVYDDMFKALQTDTPVQNKEESDQSHLQGVLHSIQLHL
jgi:hypothetical protein